MFIVLRDTVSLASGIQVSLQAPRAIFFIYVAANATVILFIISLTKTIHDESSPEWIPFIQNL